MQQKIILSRIVKNRKQIKWDWSGSINGIENALKRKCEVIEYRFFWNFPMKIKKLLQKASILSYDFESFNLCYANKKNSFSKFTMYPIIQFEEFPNSPNVQSYIYQDLSVYYIDEIANENGEEFKFSGFSYISEDAIYKRLKIQKEFYSNAKGVFTMSHWLHKYLLDNKIVEKDKLKYVGGGINLDIKKIDTSLKKKNKILFVGKDFIRKGGDLVYDAFIILNAQINSDTELYIIGPRTIPFEINNNNVHFVGEKSPNELPYYFNLCDIFVMPSRFEAYGLVFIEALVFGLPCIGRNCYEMPYFIEEGKTGYLIDNDDPLYLAQMMNELLGNNIICTNVAHRKVYYIKEYSWDTVCERMLEHIGEVGNKQ